jgi:hypothetical protein
MRVERGPEPIPGDTRMLAMTVWNLARHPSRAIRLFRRSATSQWFRVPDVAARHHTGPQVLRDRPTIDEAVRIESVLEEVGLGIQRPRIVERRAAHPGRNGESHLDVLAHVGATIRRADIAEEVRRC